ncbi:MAG: hypothetical protein E3J72_06085 [Planctomycetota bacterium]|nr:MAG: hypothetical protein E3J72_06085 [Planctomycetota bacterium]
MRYAKTFGIVLSLTALLLAACGGCRNKSKQRMLANNELEFLVTEGLTDSNVVTVTHNMEKDWWVTIDREWILADPLFGVGRNISDTRFNLGISINASELRDGTYNGDVQVTDGFNAKWWACKVRVTPDPPILNAIDPFNGPSDGGTLVTLTGTGLRPGSVVIFGDNVLDNVSTIFISETTLTCITPPNPTIGFVDVTVKVPNGKTSTLPNGFRYTDISIISVQPNVGSVDGGDLVLILGQGFVDGATTIMFGSVPAAGVTFVSTTELWVTTPPSPLPLPGYGSVNVTAEDTTNGDISTLANGYTYSPTGQPPQITLVDPDIGYWEGGDNVTILGLNFDNSVIVFFDNTAIAAGDTTFVSSTQIIVITPPHTPGNVSVMVLNNSSGLSATWSREFMYTATPRPVIDYIDPKVAYTGVNHWYSAYKTYTLMYITGEGFQNGATVFFGGTQAPPPPTYTNMNPPRTYLSENLLLVTVPYRSATGYVNIRVVNPDGQVAWIENGVEYVDTDSPRIDDVDPSIGFIGGGADITIIGSYFDDTGGLTAFIDNNAIQGIEVTQISGASRMTGTTPENTEQGSVDIMVRNEDGQFTLKFNGYKYTSTLPPSIDDISDLRAPLLGGSARGVTVPAVADVIGCTYIVLRGGNFIPGFSVEAGGVLCDHAAYENPHLASVRTPDLTNSVVAPELVMVRMTSTENQTATLYDRLVYINGSMTEQNYLWSEKTKPHHSWEEEEINMQAFALTTDTDPAGAGTFPVGVASVFFPSGVTMHDMAYIPAASTFSSTATGMLFGFGGWDGVGYVDDTYFLFWNYTGLTPVEVGDLGNWGIITAVTMTSGAPEARGQHQLVYDSSRDVIVLYGGLTGPGELKDDTWELSVAATVWTWTQIATAADPPARIGHNMVYESNGNTVIVFGGYFIGFPPQMYNDVWEYNPAGPTWTQLDDGTGVGKPAKRAYASFEFDSTRNVAVLYGGIDLATNKQYNDTWEWDVTTDTWAEIFPDGSASSAPSRDQATMVYDANRQSCIMLGGNSGLDNGLHTDIWEYDGPTQTWIKHTPTVARAGARAFGSAVYDSDRQCITVFGGNTFNYSKLYNDVWDAGTWDPNDSKQPTAP